ncbi:hypothetical protein AMTRI_Chr10g4190 [Amborella trichopoda]
MAEGAMLFCVQKLDRLLTEELRLISGVRKDIIWLRDELKIMIAFLEDADRRKSKDALVQIWVEQVREVVYDTEDVLDEFMILEARKRKFFAKSLVIQHKVGVKIQEIKERITGIKGRRDKYDIQRKEEPGTSSDTVVSSGGDPLAAYPFIDEVDVIGKQKDIENLVELLVNGGPKLKVISSHFNCRSWVTVSQLFTIVGLLKGMVEGFYDDRREVAPTMDKLDEGLLHMCLRAYLEDKRFLLVVDDIWSEDVWNRLKVSLPDHENGSRIVFTTRLINFASLVEVDHHVYELQLLKAEDAWSLFCTKAIRENDSKKVTGELERVGKLIVDNCEGLPLVIMVVGGMVSKRALEVAEWMGVLRNLNWEMANNTSLERIRRNVLIRLWVAEGFIAARPNMTMEEVGEVYMKELIDRNLIQVAYLSGSQKIRACRVHDVMRNLALSIAEKENFGAILTGESKELNDRTRRLSMHKCHAHIQVLTRKLYVRSLLTVSMEQFPHSTSSILSNLSNARLLRVLDLGGVSCQKLPSEIGSLIHLRYLGLRNTMIRELPKSLQNLRRLETLDARGGGLESVSNEISSLKHLTHLIVSRRKVSQVEFWVQLLAEGKFFFYDNCVPCNVNLGGLARLQTLKHIRVEGTFIKKLGVLNQLVKLKVQVGSMEDGKELWSTLQLMERLKCLYISSVDPENPISIDSESTSLPLPPLNKLCINVVLGRLPKALCYLQSLTELVLSASALTEDPLAALQGLYNLEFLVLHKAYKGARMGRDGIVGFPKLKTLCLLYLENLEWFGGMHRGCMPVLQDLTFIGCWKLKLWDESLRNLTSLKNFSIGNMSSPLIKSLHPHHGEDYYKIQHVPRVRLYYLVLDRLFYANLK